MLAAAPVALYFHTYTLFIIAGMALRYIAQIAILHRISGKLALSKDIAWLSPILEIQLHAINLGLYFINLLRKPKKWN
jgi:hypothetical protein